MTALLAAARAVHFASLMAVFGGSTYAVLLRRAGLGASPPKGTRPMFMIAVTLAMVSGTVWLCLIAGQMSGDPEGALDPATIEVTATGTRFGHIFLGRFIGLAALWFMCAPGARWRGLAVAVLSGLLLASLGVVSHAAATGEDMVSLGAVNDAAHLLTAGFWLGGLLVLALFLLQHRSDRASVLGALRLFSTWGSVAVAVLVITGLINAIAILPVSEMSVRNSYFDLLAAKVALASMMIGLAALNRWRLGPALRTGGRGAMRHLAGSVGSEIVLGFAVVAIVGLLGVTAPH